MAQQTEQDTLTEYLQNSLLNHIFKGITWTPPTQTWMLLYRGGPARGNVELSGSGYSRAAITFGATSGSSITNSVDILFPFSTGSWGEISALGISTSAVSGSVLCTITLSDPMVLDSEIGCFSIKTGSLTISIPSRQMTTYFSSGLLNAIFRNSASSIPTAGSSLYLGLGYVDPKTPTTFTELSGSVTGYSRKFIGTSACWSPAVSGSTTYSASLVFVDPVPDANEWVNINSIAIFNGSAAGSMLWITPVQHRNAINLLAGESLVIPANGISAKFI